MRLDISLRKKLGDFTFDAAFATETDRVGIFGRSGSGKSTLAHMIAGLIPPDGGHIELDGEVLYSSERRISLLPERRRIAVVFQNAHLFPHMDVERNLLYGYRRTPPALRKVDPAALIAVLDLGALLGRRIQALSGGERQRVALGRALLASPRLLVMDEPLSALDEALKYQIIPYLTAISEEFRVPSLLISHSLNEMRLMSEEVVVLHRGEVTGQMTPEELARQRMGWTRAGYINLLRLSPPQAVDDLYGYAFGDCRLLMWAGRRGETTFELSSKDIMLFKGHPEAISARNLLHCTVVSVSAMENRVAVELDCGGQTLIATVVARAAEEMGIGPGTKIYAVIKASAFRPLF
ncbi:molybdenum ABC transporter, ATP-binding protein [Desulfuromonas soudanensis]|uniref:Molybdenum ABC transporter, ATP-binding protein n=1 Tax=Desulfuromonas soudanensis TaxID=1603606 RepID=A0A0M3QG29_9BACT|nr:molybdenum ABC transporter ATP-binding protein [Desulfuromonas soudanensis]ALC17269.1 molybdenum ABC transporter, ATP-binding protein [Desulfuromonas soudanensis]